MLEREALAEYRLRMEIFPLFSCGIIKVNGTRKSPTPAAPKEEKEEYRTPRSVPIVKPLT
jgi:hypothetical protein